MRRSIDSTLLLLLVYAPMLFAGLRVMVWRLRHPTATETEAFLIFWPMILTCAALSILLAMLLNFIAGKRR